MSDEEIHRAWSDHGDDPSGVAERLAFLVEELDVEHTSKVALLIVHVVGEHLGQFERGLAMVDRLAHRARSATDGGGLVLTSEAIDRALALFRLCVGDTEGVEALLAQFGSRRQGQEAWIYALAAGAVSAHGRIDDAVGWLQRAASLAFSVPDSDPAVRVLATVSHDVACRFEVLSNPESGEATLLRTASQFARVFWERGGTWLEVERAEHRLARTCLALNERMGAVAHAEACVALCRANAAPEAELRAALSVLSESREVAGDAPGAAAARSEAAALR
ncbi:MAG: hypothetical protein ABMA64_14450 [Myxococcota bacterium]